MPDDVLTERLVGRLVDPETNRSYHPKFAPPPPEIQLRLVHRPEDNKDKVRARRLASRRLVSRAASYPAPPLVARRFELRASAAWRRAAVLPQPRLKLQTCASHNCFLESGAIRHLR